MLTSDFKKLNSQTQMLKYDSEQMYDNSYSM